jgi:hypothetical protein
MECSFNFKQNLKRQICLFFCEVFSSILSINPVTDQRDTKHDRYKAADCFQRGSKLAEDKTTVQKSSHNYRKNRKLAVTIIVEQQ